MAKQKQLRSFTILKQLKEQHPNASEEELCRLWEQRMKSDASLQDEFGRYLFDDVTRKYGCDTATAMLHRFRADAENVLARLREAGADEVQIQKTQREYANTKKLIESVAMLLEEGGSSH